MIPLPPVRCQYRRSRGIPRIDRGRSESHAACVDTFPVDIPDHHEGTRVVRVPSRLTHESAFSLKRTVEQCFSNHEISTMVLDMSLVEVVTSIGITSLLEVKQASDDAGASLVLAGLASQHMTFFTLLRVDRLFQFAPTVEEAVSSEG